MWRGFRGIIGTTPKYCNVAVQALVTTGILDFLVTIGLDEMGEVPVTCLDKAGIIEVLEGEFRRMMLVVIKK